jgi:ABC-type sugar transport system permease subunit
LSGRRIRFKTTWMALYLLPFVMTPVVVGITWRLFFWQPEFGVVNQLAGTFGLPQPLWLINRDTALIATMISNSWHLTPLAILVFYAALTTIPEELYEAARIDGAGPLAIIRHVVLPMLRPHILFVTIIIMTSAFREFDLIFTLTGGGPGRATTVLSILAYNRGIAAQDMGMANAIAFTMFIIMATVAWLYITLYRAREPQA